MLLHGFPYDARAYDQVVPALVAAGNRVVVPYLRGYGPTRFTSSEPLAAGQRAFGPGATVPGQVARSGQQAALGRDLEIIGYESPQRGPRSLPSRTG